MSGKKEKPIPEWMKGILIAVLLALGGVSLVFGLVAYTAHEGPYWEVVVPAWGFGVVLVLLGAVLQLYFVPRRPHK